MAEQQQQQQPLKAPFPPPPPFYKHFTKANLAQLRQRRKEAGVSEPQEESSTEPKPSLDILSLPPELRYLIPPPPPADGKWTSFSQSLSLGDPSPILADQGIEQLYPSRPSATSNPASHLLSLSRSLLTTFLAIVGILSQNPELYKEKVEDLQTILFNMHELINQYRPHQARESLILGMEERVGRMRNEIRQIREGKVKVQKLLQGLREGGEVELKREDTEDTGQAGESAKEVWKVRQRARWAAIERAVGEDGNNTTEENGVVKDAADTTSSTVPLATTEELLAAVDNIAQDGG